MKPLAPPNGAPTGAELYRFTLVRRERMRQLTFHVAAWVLGMIVATPLWALIEWQDNSAFERWSTNSQPGSWDPSDPDRRRCVGACRRDLRAAGEVGTANNSSVNVPTTQPTQPTTTRTHGRSGREAATAGCDHETHVPAGGAPAFGR